MANPSTSQRALVPALLLVLVCVGGFLLNHGGGGSIFWPARNVKDFVPDVETVESTKPSVANSGRELASAYDEHDKKASSRLVRGQVVRKSGQGVAGASVVMRSSNGADKFDVVADSDSRGHFEAFVPWSWQDLVVTAESNGGIRGGLQARMDKSSEIDLPPIVMIRRLQLRLQLDCSPESVELMHALLPSRIMVFIQQKAGGFVQERQLAAEFTLRVGGEEKFVELDCGAEDVVQWFFLPSAGGRVPLHEDLIPDDAEYVESVCILTPHHYVTGVTVDEYGKSVGNVPLIMKIDRSPAWRVSVQSDDLGSFSMMAFMGSSGVIGPRIGDQEPVVPWSTGAMVRVPCAAAGRLRIQVLDSELRPVSQFQVQKYNFRMSGIGGDDPGDAFLPRSKSGMILTEWSGLNKGERVFVRVPGVGEIVHVCVADVRPEDGPYVIKITPPVYGSLTLRIDRQIVGSLGGPVGIQLRQDGLEKIIRYNFLIPIEEAERGWTFARILPGNYRFDVNCAGRHRLSGDVLVEENVEAQLTVR